MPLKQNQLDAIDTLLEGDAPNFNTHLNSLTAARDDLESLRRRHSDMADVGATAVDASAKLAAKTAAQALVTLLS